MNLVYKNEKKLFLIAAILSGIFWFALIVGTFGIALLYLLLGYLFFLFAHSAFITHLKGTGVKITEKQYPDLHARLVRSCEKVGVTDVPEAYLLRTDFFNALATRFLGRHFVVLFTDVVDALEDQQGAIDFYIGHELGHIHRKHLSWGTFLFPASILPLLGAALRRAEEYTCDRYGVACCESEDDIKAALSAIAAGDTRWKSINIDSYVEQVALTNGFWMSFNELTGDYPWLTKRMATCLSLARGEEIKHPRRHGLAWFLSIFVPRVGTGGLASLIVTVAIIGILAAVAIPAYKDYTERARLSEGYSAAQPIKAGVTDYAVENRAWPSSLLDLGYEEESVVNHGKNYEIKIYDEGIIGVEVGDEQYLVLEPSFDYEEGSVSWTCSGQNIEEKFVPRMCK